MPVNQFIADLPDTIFAILMQITSTMKGMLTQTFGSYETYAVMAIALCLGYFGKAALSKSGDSYFWYILLSALIFMSLRYLGV